jgi:hypothetical protein
MRTREQMRATLAEYPAVSAVLDELADEHGELLVSTLDDFCERYPDSVPLQRAALRTSGSSTGWFLVTAAENRIWMVPATGDAVEITEDLPGGSERA